MAMRSKESREEEVGAEYEEEQRDHGCRALGEVRERRGSKRRRGHKGRAPARRARRSWSWRGVCASEWRTRARREE